MTAYLHGVECHLPSARCYNKDLVALNPQWDENAIYRKTGIRSRSIAASEETAVDLGYEAAEKVMAQTQTPRDAIDAILFCTESPDYLLPPSACILQERLGLSTHAAAFDFNLGCSGFTYGLWLARSLVLSGSSRKVLLICADTYSKLCNPHDLATATIFGDGAGAAIVSGDPTGAIAEVGPSVVGTDGRGAENLIVRGSGARRMPARAEIPSGPTGIGSGHGFLCMNGPEIYAFALATICPEVNRLLTTVQLPWESVDLFLMHQANKYMLESLRDVMKILPERMPIDMEDIGNTVSASLPVLLARCRTRGTLKPGQHCVLAGFGVGYSWAMTYLKWLS